MEQSSSNPGNRFFIDGKVFIVGEKKISMWKKSKCNKDKDKDKDKANDNDNDNDQNLHVIIK